MEVYLYLTKIMMFSALFVALLGIFNWKYLFTNFRIFIGLQLFAFLCDLLSWILSSYGLPNNHVSTTYSIVGSILVACFYYLLIKRAKTIFISLSTIVITFMLANWFFIQKENPNSNAAAAHCLLILVLSITAFYFLMNKIPNERLTHLSVFWINVGMLMYGSGVLFIWILTDYLIDSVKDDLIYYFDFHHLLSILSNLIFFYGVWLEIKTNKIKAAESGAIN